jgi:hypothetical protein
MTVPRRSKCGPNASLRTRSAVANELRDLPKRGSADGTGTADTWVHPHTTTLAMVEPVDMVHERLEDWRAAAEAKWAFR